MIEEIKAQIAALYDPVQLLDMLDMDMEELVDVLEDRIIESLYLFKDVGCYYDE